MRAALRTALCLLPILVGSALPASAQNQPGQYPPSQYPPSQYPPEQNSPGQYPPGQNPPGQYPPPADPYPPPRQYRQPPPPQNPPPSAQYAPGEIMDAGHRFFGSVSRGFAQIVERAVSQWGLPNGYILGQEAGGAFVAGLRYGEGTLYTKNAGDLRVFWQGPSVGYDFGGEGARTMMLVYNLPATEAIYQRFGGVDGSAYLVGGFGMTVLTANNVVLVPIRSGLGLRLGASIGYLKFTPQATWNPL